MSVDIPPHQEEKVRQATLGPARIPPAFKQQPVTQLLHLPLDSGTWRRII